MRLMTAVFFLVVLSVGDGIPFALSASAPAAPDKKEYRIGDRLQQVPAQSTADSSYKEMKWEALVPADWDPMRVFKGLDLSKLSDADPRAMDALQRLREEWNHAPPNTSLKGARIRIAGFIVPLESSRKQTTEFLLVPYFGACIHSPPPPSNQIIHVFPAKPLQNAQAMDTVWISGTLEVVRSQTEMGTAGYRMKAEVVAPYKKPR